MTILCLFFTAGLATTRIAAGAEGTAVSPSSPVSAKKWHSLAEILAQWQSRPLTEVQGAAEGGDLTAQHYLGYYYLQGVGGKPDYQAGLGWYRRAAEKNFPNSLNNLGVAYRNGIGVPKDLDRARQFFQQAADQGFPMALKNLIGLANQGGQTNSMSVEKIRELLERGAESNDPESQVILGGLLIEGLPGFAAEPMNGVYFLRRAYAQGRVDVCATIGWVYFHEGATPRDLPAAVEWFGRGVKAGEADAMMGLAWLHLLGQGVKQDRDEAMKLMHQAADKNYLPAIRNIGRVLAMVDMPVQRPDWPIDDAEAVRWLRKAADLGDQRAYRYLNELIEEGRSGGNAREDLLWTRKAADSGNSDAQLKLADLYLAGTAQPRSAAEEPWVIIEQLARRGNLTANMRLGGRYRKGAGVPKDNFKASFYYIAAGWDTDATEMLDQKLQPRGGLTKEDQAFAEVFARMLRALKEDDRQFMIDAARRYETAEGVERDLIQASAWYQAAAKLGVSEAAAKSAELDAKLVEADRARARKLGASLSYEGEWLRQPH